MVMVSPAPRHVEVAVNGALHGHGEHFAIRTAVDPQWIERSIQVWVRDQRASGKRPGENTRADEAGGKRDGGVA